MASKATISFLRSLQQKKFRLKERAFVVEGPKLVNELFHSDFKVLSVYALASWIPEPHVSVPVEVISEKEMEQVSGLQTPNKVLAVVALPDDNHRFTAPDAGLHLLVDQIQDPGNLGTIIRIADWFGFRSVICSLDTVDVFNPKVVQSTMGSIFRIPVIYDALPDVLVKNASGPKLPVYATLLEGKNMYSEDLTDNGYVLMGNESRGLNPMLLPFVNRAIKIPGPGQKGGKAESLNVAIAAGVVCAEFRRRFPL